MTFPFLLSLFEAVSSLRTPGEAMRNRNWDGAMIPAVQSAAKCASIEGNKLPVQALTDENSIPTMNVARRPRRPW